MVHTRAQVTVTSCHGSRCESKASFAKGQRGAAFGGDGSSALSASFGGYVWWILDELRNHQFAKSYYIKYLISQAQKKFRMGRVSRPRFGVSQGRFRSAMWSRSGHDAVDAWSGYGHGHHRSLPVRKKRGVVQLACGPHRWAQSNHGRFGMISPGDPTMENPTCFSQRCDASVRGHDSPAEASTGHCAVFAEESVYRQIDALLVKEKSSAIRADRLQVSKRMDWVVGFNYWIELLFVLNIIRNLKFVFVI